MEHRDVQYQVDEMTDATAFVWTVHLDETIRIGVSFSKENASLNAVRAIDKALGSQAVATPSARSSTPKR
jgi:hypothetical protein